MPSLEPARSQTTLWTAGRVRQRMLEACSIERRLPGEFFTRIATAWPATPIHEFADKVHWDDARQRVWDGWERAKYAWPYEISRMEETIGWLLYLPEAERKCLWAWAAAAAGGKPIRKVLRKHGWTITTFYRHRNNGLARIAKRLNQQGVQVR
jgi:Domain of unknown function (DUF6362)